MFLCWKLFLIKLFLFLANFPPLPLLIEMWQKYDICNINDGNSKTLIPDNPAHVLNICCFFLKAIDSFFLGIKSIYSNLIFCLDWKHSSSNYVKTDMVKILAILEQNISGKLKYSLLFYGFLVKMATNVSMF